MGLIQSVFCSATFCVERVLTWTCCAFLLMLLMFSIVMLMVYGISVGYHYAQKELSSFAMSSRSTTEASLMMARSGQERPVVRLLAVNRSEVEHAPHPLIEVYETKKPGENIYLEPTPTPVVLLETERLVCHTYFPVLQNTSLGLHGLIAGILQPTKHNIRHKPMRILSSGSTPSRASKIKILPKRQSLHNLLPIIWKERRVARCSELPRDENSKYSTRNRMSAAPSHPDQNYLQPH